MMFGIRHVSLQAQVSRVDQAEDDSAAVASSSQNALVSWEACLGISRARSRSTKSETARVVER